MRSEIKLPSSELRELNDNLYLSNALTVETVSQSNYVNFGCDDNLIVANGDIGNPLKRVTVLIVWSKYKFYIESFSRQMLVENCSFIKIK